MPVSADDTLVFEDEQTMLVDVLFDLLHNVFGNRLFQIDTSHFHANWSRGVLHSSLQLGCVDCVVTVQSQNRKGVAEVLKVCFFAVAPIQQCRRPFDHQSCPFGFTRKCVSLSLSGA